MYCCGSWNIQNVSKQLKLNVIAFRTANWDVKQLKVDQNYIYR